MTETPPTLTAEDAEILDQVILDVTRRYRMRPADAQDFTQSVHVRLLERGYDVFSRFEGRCSKRGYLSVVVKRLALDWLNTHYGRWRPSAAARRMGPVAVVLDRMIHRDGYSAADAISSQANQAEATADDLRQMVEKLPARTRRRVVGIETLERERSLAFDDPVFGAEQREAARFISGRLSQLVQDLPHEDRRMLNLRYRHQHTVQAIAQHLGVDAKRLYRRFDHTLLVLRNKLVAQGVTGPASRSPEVH